MKTIKNYGFLSLLTIAITISSCVQDGDFTVPNVISGRTFYNC